MTPSTLPEFTETAPHEKGFGIFYRKEILPVLANLEENRLKLLATQKTYMAIAVPVSIVAGILGFVVLPQLLPGIMNMDNRILPALALGVIGWSLWWAKSPSRKYAVDVKSIYMPIVCNFFGDLKYSSNGQSQIEATLEEELFPRFNKSEMEDFIEGSARDIKLKLHESTLTSSNGKSTVTVFSGLVLELEFPKAFKGKTIVLGKHGYVKNLESVQLEDPEFASLFQVYGSDQIEARFLLTTAFMERLLQLGKLLSGDKTIGGKIQCEFTGQKLVIAINSYQNLFEPRGLTQTALQVNDLHDFLAQMDGIFKLIEALKIRRA